MLIFGYAPWILWALGAIPWYLVAMIMSVSLLVAVSAWTIRQVRYYETKTIEAISQKETGFQASNHTDDE
jgi:hypothetical protein